MNINIIIINNLFNNDKKEGNLQQGCTVKLAI